MRILFSILFMCLASQAGAQVYKCQDATGRILVSDRPCSGAYQGGNVQKSQDRVSASQRHQAASLRAAQTQQMMSLNRGGALVSSVGGGSRQGQGGYWVCQ
jgi:hypothetical protein